MGGAGASHVDSALCWECREALSPTNSATSQGQGMGGNYAFPWSHHEAMASFALEGATCKYLHPGPGHAAEAAHPSDYGYYPKIMAALPLPGRAWGSGNCRPLDRLKLYGIRGKNLAELDRPGMNQKAPPFRGKSEGRG